MTPAISNLPSGDYPPKDGIEHIRSLNLGAVKNEQIFTPMQKGLWGNKRAPGQRPPWAGLYQFSKLIFTFVFYFLLSARLRQVGERSSFSAQRNA